MRISLYSQLLRLLRCASRLRDLRGDLLAETPEPYVLERDLPYFCGEHLLVAKLYWRAGSPPGDTC